VQELDHALFGSPAMDHKIPASVTAHRLLSELEEQL